MLVAFLLAAVTFVAFAPPETLSGLAAASAAVMRWLLGRVGAEWTGRVGSIRVVPGRV